MQCIKRAGVSSSDSGDQVIPSLAATSEVFANSSDFLNRIGGAARATCCQSGIQLCIERGGPPLHVLANTGRRNLISVFHNSNVFRIAASAPPRFISTCRIYQFLLLTYSAFFIVSVG